MFFWRRLGPPLCLQPTKTIIVHKFLKTYGFLVAYKSIKTPIKSTNFKPAKPFAQSFPCIAFIAY